MSAGRAASEQLESGELAESQQKGGGKQQASKGAEFERRPVGQPARKLDALPPNLEPPKRRTKVAPN